MKDRGERTRTVTWQPPQKDGSLPGRMSGRDYLSAIQQGTLPRAPIAELVDYTIAAVEPGRTVFELVPQEFHYNPFGVVHGGIVSTLLDSTLTAAVLSELPVGAECATIGITVNFIRTLTIETGKVRCEGRTLHMGRQLATAQAEILDSRGDRYAHAVGTCMVRRR